MEKILDQTSMASASQCKAKQQQKKYCTFVENGKLCKFAVSQISVSCSVLKANRISQPCLKTGKI